MTERIVCYWPRCGNASTHVVGDLTYCYNHSLVVEDIRDFDWVKLFGVQFRTRGRKVQPRVTDEKEQQQSGTRCDNQRRAT